MARTKKTEKVKDPSTGRYYNRKVDEVGPRMRSGDEYPLPFSRKNCASESESDLSEDPIEFLEIPRNKTVEDQESHLVKIDGTPSLKVKSETSSKLSTKLKRPAETDLPMEILQKKLHPNQPSQEIQVHQVIPLDIGSSRRSELHIQIQDPPTVRIEDQTNQPEEAQNISEDFLHIDEIEAESDLEERKENDIIESQIRRQRRRQFPTRHAKDQVNGLKVNKIFKARRWTFKDPRDYYLGEKLPGVACIWDGKNSFITRNRVRYCAPEGFLANFPPQCMIGILHKNGRTSSTVTRKMESQNFEDWEDLVFFVYDIIAGKKDNFESRIQNLQQLLPAPELRHIRRCQYHLCTGSQDFEAKCNTARNNNSEGVFLNKPKMARIDRGFYIKKLQN